MNGIIISLILHVSYKRVHVSIFKIAFLLFDYKSNWYVKLPNTGENVCVIWTYKVNEKRPSELASTLVYFMTCPVMLGTDSKEYKCTK